MNKVFLIQILVLSILSSACNSSSEVHNLALNEDNIDKVQNLATFGTAGEQCLISSSLNSALETRLVNGQAEYLLALTDLESQNIQLWNLAMEKTFILLTALMLTVFYSILTTEH